MVFLNFFMKTFSAQKKREKIIKITALVLFSVLIALVGIFLFQFAACFAYAKDVPDIPSFAAVRFVIYGSGIDTVSARVVLCDTKGNAIAEIERSWKGTSLSLEFARASFGGKSVYVPYRIAAAGAGGFAGFQNAVTSVTAVKKHFLKNGQSLFFAQENPQEKKAFYVFSRFALNAGTRFGSRFGSVKTLSLAECENGAYYAVMLDTRGSVFLVKE
jgi:hypothetical protein